MKFASQVVEMSPQPTPRATGLFLAGLLLTVVLAEGGSTSTLANSYALGIAGAFAVSLLADYRGNIRNLVRADIMALCSFYFLTLAEYCVPQPMADLVMSVEEARPALQGCAVGFAGLVIGRHFFFRAPANLRQLIQKEPPQNFLIVLFTVCFVGGYWYMLASVDYSVSAMLDAFMAPRFMQPWGRGRFGDWRALLYELGMVLYLVPPIGGVILADRKKFRPFTLVLVAAGLAFTFFYGYTSGTRNIFATYLATCLVAYAFAAGRHRRKEVLVIGLVAAGAMIYATTTMLEFRNVGYRAYLAGVSEGGADAEQKPFFVDNNLVVVGRLMQVFPYPHPFLGLEIPYLALIRPIPRALWSGKPEGMSMSIETALGADETYTLAASFVGEAYMSGGFLAIFAFGFCLGSIMGWWNQLGREDNSGFGYLLYASGFFAAVISMRSLLTFTTAILPTIAAIVFGHWAIKTGMQRFRERHAETEEEPPRHE